MGLKPGQPFRTILRRWREALRIKPKRKASPGPRNPQTRKGHERMSTRQNSVRQNKAIVAGDAAREPIGE